MTPPSSTQGVITCILARHSGEAAGLGRSLRLNSPELPSVCLVEGTLTDAQQAELAACFTEVIAMRPEHFRLGWLVKHVVWEYSPFEHTLFLDSDCLVLRDLRPAFAEAGMRPICFATKPEPTQEQGAALYAGISLKYLFERFSVDWWPQILCGGHFFFRRTPEAQRLFTRARALGAPDIVHEFGWTDKSKIAPDELTLQLALVEAGLGRACALVDYPLVCWTPWETARPDVFARRISLRDRTTGKRRWDENTFVAHFGGDATNVDYRREQWRLKLFGAPGIAASLAKPVLHVAAHASRKARNGWGRIRRLAGAKR
jgi:hypothetical protein